MLCLGLFATAFSEPVEKYSNVEFDLSKVSMKTLDELGLPTDHHHVQGTQTIFSMPLSQSDIALLKAEKIPYRILVEDYARMIELRNIELAKAAPNHTPGEAPLARVPKNFKLGAMGGHLTFAEMVAVLDDMRTKYPKLITAKMELGKTGEGRSMWAVRISNNADVEQNRPRVLYDALIHAREPISMMHVIYYMWYLLENYETDLEVKKLLDNLEIYAIPCMNPDGYEYNRSTNPNGGGMHRKNRFKNADGSYGVDLNRNYSTFWGDDIGSSNVQNSDTYRGTKAFSEPETRASRDLRLAKKFTLSFNHHSFANRLLTPYGIGGWPPNKADYERIAKELTRVTKWLYGPTPVMLNYSVSGAAKDWGHEVGKEFAFGSETGGDADGFWPVSNRIGALCDGVLDMNLTLARNALPPVLRIETPIRKITPQFYADLNNSAGKVTLSYQLTDFKNNWFLSVYDMHGKQYKRVPLSPNNKSLVFSQGDFPRSVYLFEIKSCGGSGCQTMDQQKQMLGGF